MNDRVTETQKGSIGRIRAGAEAILVLLTVTPAIIFIAIYAPRIGLTSPALAPLGIWISVGIASIFLWMSKTKWRDIGLRLPKNLMLSIAAGLAFAVVGVIVYDWLVFALESAGATPLDLSALSSAIEGNFWVYVQFMVLVVWGSAGIGEELFARGFLFHRFERLFRGLPIAWLIAALVQAVVFGSLHAYQGPIGMAASGAIGFMMALLFLAMGRNLMAPIIAHGAIDSYAIIMMYLGKSPLPGFFG